MAAHSPVVPDLHRILVGKGWLPKVVGSLLELKMLDPQSSLARMAQPTKTVGNPLKLNALAAVQTPVAVGLDGLVVTLDP